jgi:hypothetical protein
MSWELNQPHPTRNRRQLDQSERLMRRLIVRTVMSSRASTLSSNARPGQTIPTSSNDKTTKEKQDPMRLKTPFDDSFPVAQLIQFFQSHFKSYSSLCSPNATQ